MAAIDLLRAAPDALEQSLWLDDPAPRHEAPRGRLKRRLGHVLPQLTPMQQEVLRLYYGEGFTLREIAEQLGRSPSTISRCRQRGMLRLQSMLELTLAMEHPPENQDSNSRGSRV